MVDFSRYQPPGVYVQDATTPVTAFQGFSAFPETVGIVGPALEFRASSESVTMSETPKTLLAGGIDVSTVTVTPIAGGVPYVVDVDYVLAQVGTPGAPTTTTSIALLQGGDIAEGEIVTVAFRYADEAFFGVNRFTEFESVEGFYGPALDLESNEIISPLTLAARIAFENGARSVALVTTPAAGSVTVQALTDGLAKLDAASDVGLVVPLAVGVSDTDAPGVAIALAAHIARTVNDGNFRVGLLGFDTAVTLDHAVVAESIENERIVLAFPNRLNYYNGETNQTLLVGGQYLASAYAGQLVRNGISFPLTRKRVRSFAGLPGSVVAQMSRSFKDNLSSRGVAVAELTRAQSLVVRHGVTTDRTNVMTREVSLVRAKDAMVIAIETALENSGVIGNPMTEDTPLIVKALITGALETVKENRTIVNYREVRVRQPSTRPDVIEAKFEYRPAYPLNYVLVSFSVDIASGEVDLTQPTTA
jgi:hypothetical protein